MQNDLFKRSYISRNEGMDAAEIFWLVQESFTARGWIEHIPETVVLISLGWHPMRIHAWHNEKASGFNTTTRVHTLCDTTLSIVIIVNII